MTKATNGRAALTAVKTPVEGLGEHSSSCSHSSKSSLEETGPETATGTEMEGAECNTKRSIRIAGKAAAGKAAAAKETKAAARAAGTAAKAAGAAAAAEAAAVEAAAAPRGLGSQRQTAPSGSGQQGQTGMDEWACGASLSGDSSSTGFGSGGGGCGRGGFGSGIGEEANIGGLSMQLVQAYGGATTMLELSLPRPAAAEGEAPRIGLRRRASHSAFQSFLNLDTAAAAAQVVSRHVEPAVEARAEGGATLGAGAYTRPLFSST